MTQLRAHKLSHIQRQAHALIPCPICCLEALRRELDQSEMSAVERLRWIRTRDALYQHGERHFGANGEWWTMFEAFESVAAKAVF